MDLQQESLAMHLKNHGKMEIRCKAPLNDRHDLAVAYTPGVAEPCKDVSVFSISGLPSVYSGVIPDSPSLENISGAPGQEQSAARVSSPISESDIAASFAEEYI